MNYIIFIISMSSLIYGANHIIAQSEKIAIKFNISHFVIGATLIGFGTSLPEMAASMMASYYDKPDIAIANVLGSVIFNISLILGVVFLINKQKDTKRDIFAKDTAWSLIPLIFFIIMTYDGVLSFFDGIIFLSLMAGYIYFLSKDSKAIEDEVSDEASLEFNIYKSLFWLVFGFVLVILGAKFTITSASEIALSLGVSEWVVALVLIAFGTSLPELIVSIVAVRKKNLDMIIGNIIGSNIANFTIVLGSSAVLKPLLFDFSKNGFDLILASFSMLLLMFFTANRLYNKSSAIVLFCILALMLSNSISSF